MFGFGKSASYRDTVWNILNSIHVTQFLPTMAPLNTEIEKHRLHKFSEYEAALLICYSSSLSIAEAGDVAKAQRLYDLARNMQDGWIEKGLVDYADALGFNKHIAGNSKIIARV